MLHQLDRAIGYASDGANLLRHQIRPALTGIGYGILLNRTLAKNITWLHPVCLPMAFAALVIVNNAAQEKLDRIPGSIFYMNSLADKINRVGKQQLEYLADPYHSARKLTCKAIVLTIQLVHRAAIGYLAGAAATYTCNYFASEKLKAFLELGLSAQGIDAIEPVYAAAMGVAFLLLGKLMPDNDQQEQSTHPVRATKEKSELGDQDKELLARPRAEHQRVKNAEIPFIHLLYEELKSSSPTPEPEVPKAPDLSNLAPDLSNLAPDLSNLLRLVGVNIARGLICNTVVLAAIPQAMVILPTMTGCAIAATALLTSQVAIEIIAHYGKH